MTKRGKEGWKTWEEFANAPTPRTFVNEPFVELRLVVNNERPKEGEKEKKQ